MSEIDVTSELSGDNYFLSEIVTYDNNEFMPKTFFKCDYFAIDEEYCNFSNDINEKIKGISPADFGEKYKSCGTFYYEAELSCFAKINGEVFFKFKDDYQDETLVIGIKEDYYKEIVEKTGSVLKIEYNHKFQEEKYDTIQNYNFEYLLVDNYSLIGWLEAKTFNIYKKIKNKKDIKTILLNSVNEANFKSGNFVVINNELYCLK